MSRTLLKAAELGRTGMSITRVGFGARAIGDGAPESGSRPRDDEETIAAIHRALDAGVNWIDTAADGYGRSEEIVGRALEGMTERPYVFTKSSLLERARPGMPHSFERDSVRAQVQASIRRLQVDAIDLYHVRWPDLGSDITQAWAALAEVKQQGLVRHIGASNFGIKQLRRVQRIAPVETLQRPYSLIAREAESDIFPFVGRERIGVIVDSPIASGLLTGSMNRDHVAHLADNDRRKCDSRFQEPQLSRHLALLERVRVVAGRHDTTPGAVAIAWTLANPGVQAAVVGFRRPDQVDPLLPAAGLELTDDDLAYLEDTAP